MNRLGLFHTYSDNNLTDTNKTLLPKTYKYEGVLTRTCERKDSQKKIQRCYFHGRGDKSTLASQIFGRKT